MEVGAKVMAKWSERIVDHTTEGKVYEVVEVDQIGFRIINDKGIKCLPISTSFTRVE